MNSTTLSKNIFIALAFLALVMPFLALAQAGAATSGDFISFKVNMALATRMAYVWTAVAAALIIFALVGKYMGGGALGRPIALMGVGALINAVVGSVPILMSLFSDIIVSPGTEIQFIFLGSLIFNISVLAGVFWIAKVFGVLMVR